MIYIFYKKKEWQEWVSWPCSTKEEAEKVRHTLKEQGYQVQG